MDLKIECLKGRGKVPGILIRLLRPYRLDDFIVFTREERTKLNKCLDQCEASHIAAADEFRKDEDESGTGYAYYNLANHLRTAFRFNKAKKYLRLAKCVADRYRDENLLSSIKVLERSIRARNRDIPNYLAGERRDNLR
jgi:hypothetical protein